MEEILASIRRIIADDDGAKGQPKASEPVAPPAAASPPRPAIPPAPPPRPAAAAPAPEPATLQDEIEALLAKPQAAPTPAPPPPPEPAAEIFDLTESMAAAAPAPIPPGHGFRTIDAQSDVVFDERPLEPPPQAAGEERARFRDGDEHSLISNATTAAVDSAFNTLAHTVLVQNARTLEDLVKEMLRPMLKTWLDDNLPGMVERLVRAEIERVSRGRS
jgi:cell pole-organizing protein PopZ